jgi:hypothetical protein
MDRSCSLSSRPIPVFLRRAPPLSRPADLDGAIWLLGAGPTVRLHLHESRENPAWHDHLRGALVARQGVIIDHRLSQKDVVVFKPPDLGDVHAAALSLLHPPSFATHRPNCLAQSVALAPSSFRNRSQVALVDVGIVRPSQEEEIVGLIGPPLDPASRERTMKSIHISSMNIVIPTSRDIWTIVETSLAHARSYQQSNTPMTLV